MPGRCPECGTAEANRNKAEGADARARLVAAMWRQGMDASQIARFFGVKSKSVSVRISQYRARGYDLPYRRPEMIKCAHMTTATRLGIDVDEVPVRITTEQRVQRVPRKQRVGKQARSAPQVVRSVKPRQKPKTRLTGFTLARRKGTPYDQFLERLRQEQRRAIGSK